jgi:hypothetical protein
VEFEPTTLTEAYYIYSAYSLRCFAKGMCSTICGPTAGVTGGRGVDNAGEQRKLDARKMPETATNPRRPVHAVLGGLFELKIARFPACKVD